MANGYVGNEPYQYEGGGILRRVSWGAIFGGLVVSLTIMLVLNLLGLGVGLGAINPATEEHPLGGIGVGAGLWLGFSSLIALFCGGWVTARLAGSVRGLNGVLHSIVVWGLVTITAFYLMTTAVGSVISGGIGVLGKGLSAVSSGVQAVAPQAANAIEQELAKHGVTADSLVNQIEQTLRASGKKELQPGQLQQRAQETGKAAKGAATGGGAQTPQAVEQELRQAVQKIVTSGQAVVNAADRDALVNVLVNRTGMNRAQAEQTIDGWIQEYQKAVQGAQQAKQQALQAAQKAMNTLSWASIWLFVLLVLDALVAAWGGWLGSRRELAQPLS